MITMSRRWLLAAAVVLTALGSLDAQETRIVYYYPAFVYPPCGTIVAYRAWAVTVPLMITPAPVLTPALPHTAPQTPAPASGDTSWTPAGSGPQVIESHAPAAQVPPPKFYDAYYVAGAAATTPQETCSIAFWNVADHPVHLNVAGTSHTLARHQQVTLHLPRQFQWQVDQRPPEPTQVAQEQGALEIVIRR